LKKDSEVLKTVLMCLGCYAVGSIVVAVLWPPLLRLLSHVPLTLPPVASQAAAVLVFLVIAHNQRGYLPAEGVVFRCLYSIACAAFALSTAFSGRYNAGTARVETAFVVMLLWTIYSHRKGRVRSIEDSELKSSPPAPGR
jgi:hypothetical protein